MGAGATSPLGIGVAVVGTGFGCLVHVRALSAAGFDVVALVGRDPERTALRAARFGIPNAVTSLSDALALPGVDAVTIATPPSTHAPLVQEAIAAGRHVICEKPFMLDALEAEAALDAAEKAGVVHFVATEFRWGEAENVVARLVADGAIGEPRLATSLLLMPLLGAPDSETPGWWIDPERGGGWLGAHASHAIDQVRMTLGEFEGLSAALPHVSSHEWPVEDTYTVHYRLRNGVDGTITSSACTWGPPVVSTRISGTEGTVWVDFGGVHVAGPDGTRDVPVPDDLRLPPPAPPPADLLVTAYDLMHSTGLELAPFTRLAGTFGDLILGRDVPAEPKPPTFADGVATMRIIDAIRTAAADRRWVTL